MFNLHYSSLYNVIDHIFGIGKKRFSYLKTVIKFLREILIDIIYAVIALYNFIVIYLIQDEKDIYNRENSKDKKLEDINGNQNKDKTTTLPSDILFINQKRNAIVQVM